MMQQMFHANRFQRTCKTKKFSWLLFFREQVSAASNIYLCFVSDYFYMAEDV